MTIKPGHRNPLSCLAALAGLTLLATGCSQSEAATPRPPAVEAAAPVETAKSRVDEDVYSLEMKASGPYKAGQEGSVEITLAAKGDYKINDKYPSKFKVVEPAADGVTYPRPLLKHEDGKFEEKTGSLKVPFVAAKSGKTKVAGVLSFSVCSANNCRIEKQALEASVDVE